MQDAADLHFAVGKNLRRPFHREVTDADHPLWFQQLHRLAQMPVAGGKQRDSFRHRQFVRRKVAAAGFHENKGTIIHHQMIAEKLFRRSKPLRKQSPQTPPADLGALAGEARHWPLGMFARWLSDGNFDAEPIAHRRDFAERHAGLRHAERAGVHAKKQDALGAGAKFFQIGGVSRPGVAQRVIDVGNGGRETKLFNFIAESLGGLDKRLARHGLGQGEKLFRRLLARFARLPGLRGFPRFTGLAWWTRLTSFALVVVAGTVNPAHGALQRFDLALIVNLLAFGELQRFEDVIHLFERVLQLGNDRVDLFDGLGDGAVFRAAFALGLRGAGRFVLRRTFARRLLIPRRAGLLALLIPATNYGRGA